MVTGDGRDVVTLRADLNSNTLVKSSSMTVCKSVDIRMFRTDQHSIRSCRSALFLDSINGRARSRYAFHPFEADGNKASNARKPSDGSR